MFKSQLKKHYVSRDNNTYKDAQVFMEKKQTQADWHVQVSHRECVWRVGCEGDMSGVFVRGLCEVWERGKVSLGDSTKRSEVHTPPPKWKGGLRRL